jgi:hypothetical protein
LDEDRFEAVLDAVRWLSPDRVLSSHLPAASRSVDRFLNVLRSPRDAEPFVAPNQSAFEEMIAQMGPPSPGVIEIEGNQMSARGGA